MFEIKPTIKTLKRLRPLSEFSEEQLQTLAGQLKVQNGKPKEVLIEMGCTDEYSLFVLQGEITSKARDDKTSNITVESDGKLNPIAQLRPSMYEVKAVGAVEYLRIEKSLLTSFAQSTETDTCGIAVETIDPGEDANPLTVHLFQDLMTDSVSLPSLPDVALRIQKLFREDDVDADKIAKVLMTDPAITAKLIKVANSPVYQGIASTDTLQAAIVRLGMQTTYKQVMAYAVSELFSSKSRNVANRMKELWVHSRKVAAISRVLAAKTKLVNPEEAMLAGLMHDLGVIVIVEYLQNYCDMTSDKKSMEKAINMMRPQITGLLMRKWNFSEEVVMVAEECEDWFRNKSDDADLCDLIIVAQYHSMIGTESMSSLPPITKLPAMSKLNLGVQESMDLIKESNKEISEVEKMLI